MTHSHPPDEAPDWEALARFRAGESAPDEAAFVARWLETHPDEMRLLDELDGTLGRHLAIEPAQVPVDVDAALVTMHRRMDAIDRPAAPRLELLQGGAHAGTTRRARRLALGGLAAAAAIAALAVGLNRNASRADDASRTSATSAGRTFVAGVGVYSVLLSDGSRVVLAPGSRLSVASTFGAGTRELTLDGVARFTVHHDASSPFTIRAGTATIRDVGTQFVVRASDLEHLAVTVAVLEGEVSFASASRGSAATTLKAGDRAQLRAGGAIVAEHGVAGPDDEAWTHGALVFRDASMDEVRDELRRWYGIDLRVGDASIRSRRLTGTFERGPVDEVEELIALALGARVERSGAVATLRAAARGP